MKFIEIFFDSEALTLDFIHRHQVNIFNVSYISNPDVGEYKGWIVRYIPNR